MWERCSCGSQQRRLYCVRASFAERQVTRENELRVYRNTVPPSRCRDLRQPSTERQCRLTAAASCVDRYGDWSPVSISNFYSDWEWRKNVLVRCCGQFQAKVHRYFNFSIPERFFYFDWSMGLAKGDSNFSKRPSARLSEDSIRSTCHHWDETYVFFFLLVRRSPTVRGKNTTFHVLSSKRDRFKTTMKEIIFGAVVEIVYEK